MLAYSSRLAFVGRPVRRAARPSAARRAADTNRPRGALSSRFTSVTFAAFRLHRDARPQPSKKKNLSCPYASYLSRDASFRVSAPEEGRLRAVTGLRSSQPAALLGPGSGEVSGLERASRGQRGAQFAPGWVGMEPILKSILTPAPILQYFTQYSAPSAPILKP